MHRRAKTHRDNFRGLTIYIAGVSEFFCDVRDFEKFATTHFVSSFLYSSRTALSQMFYVSSGKR